MKDKLKRLASVHWIGVKFSEQQMKPTFDDQIAFCDAISEAIVRSSIVLTERNLKTDEMKFLFGWSQQLKVDSKKLVSDFGIAESIADQILISLNPIKKQVKSIILNGDEADIFIGLIQPEQAPPIFKKWYLKTGKLPIYKLSPLAVDCASCAVECFNENYPVFSFGCEGSRQKEHISRDRLIVAVPNSVEYLTDGS